MHKDTRTTMNAMISPLKWKKQTNNKSHMYIVRNLYIPLLYKENQGVSVAHASVWQWAS